MGIIRGGLLVIVSVLFLISMLALNTLLTVGSSLEPQTIKVNLGDVLTNAATEEFNVTKIIDESLPIMRQYCKNNTEFSLDTNLTDFDVNISCESINNSSYAVLDEFVNDTVDEAYYKNYSCEFLNCFEQKENALYIISNNFKDYVFSKFYLGLIVVIVLFLLMFILTENRSNSFIIAGILIIVSALPFLKIQSFVSSIGGLAVGFLKLIFSASYSVFVRVLVIGIIVLGLGIVLKFFDIGFKISSFFDKFKKSRDETVSKEEVQNIVKEEVEKSKGKLITTSTKKKNVKKK